MMRVNTRLRELYFDELMNGQHEGTRLVFIREFSQHNCYQKGMNNG